MADVTLHFFIGLSAGSLIFLRVVFKPWLNGDKLAAPMGKWLLLIYIAAFFAITPNLLSRCGLPQEICHGWWMNIFFFHPLINKLVDGGMLIGRIGITLSFFLHYILLLAAANRSCRPGALTGRANQ